MENEKPLVSILIPVFNRREIVSEAIESARRQTYKNIEIIVSDNCSTDGTLEILHALEKADHRIKVISNLKNLGPVENWVKCLSAASGKYALFLWSDDIIEESLLENGLQQFTEQIGFVIGAYSIFNEKGSYYSSKFQKKYLELDSNKFLQEVLFYQVSDFPFSPAGTIFRLQDLRNALMVDIPNSLNLEFKKYGAGNDLLLFLITANKYEKIISMPVEGVRFRNHKGSITMTTNLFKFYEFARLYFVKEYRADFFPLLTAKYMIKRLFSNNFQFFYQTTKPYRNDRYLFTYLLTLIKRKIEYFL